MANVDGASARIRLNGKEFKKLLDAILHAFVGLSDLEQCLLFNLDEQINHIVRSPATLKDQVFDLIRWAESQGRTNELVRGLRECVPGNPSLKQAAADLYPGTEIDKDAVDELLEKLVATDPAEFSDTVAWRRAMIQAEWKVCRIERQEGAATGTGFLIGPDLLLTNHHVRVEANFANNHSSVRLRFGFREDADQEPGSDAGALRRLSNDWLVHESDTNKLDYTIARLQGEPGNEPIGEFKSAPQRGWLKPRPIDVNKGQGLFILQHPMGDTLKMANGGLLEIVGDWIQYVVNTKKGSSGSPVFNNQWELIALHSRYGADEFNKGVQISSILSDLPDDVRNLLQ